MSVAAGDTIRRRSLMPEAPDATTPRPPFTPWDRRELPGLFSVEESARRVGNYKWVEMRLFEVLGGYRVLIPHKIAAYTYHLNATSSITDAPTIRWLKFILIDEMDDWRDGEMMLQSLIRTPSEVERAAARARELEALMVEAGGI